MITSRIKEKGFTIIETLIAILVLSLSITGPLFYVSSSFHLAKQAKYRMTGYFLALETLEEIKFVRDIAISDTAVGVDSTNTWADNFDIGATYFDWDKELGTFKNDCIASLPAPPCGSLEYDTTSGYHYGAGTGNSIFYRYVEIIEDGSRPNERKVVITVGWNDGIVDGELEVVEFVYNFNT